MILKCIMGVLMSLQNNMQAKNKWVLKKICLLSLAAFLLFSWTGSGFCSPLEQIRNAFDRDFNRMNPEKIKDRFVSIVEDISGMKVKNQVGISYRSRGDVKNELFLQDMKKWNLNNNKKMQGYEYILKRFHLLASDTSFKDVYLKSYYDHLYGYYDPSKKSIILMEGIHKLVAENVLFHEIVHAAQDSAVDLIKYQEKHSSSFDATLAASALLEGQASAVELIARIERNLEGKAKNEILSDLLDRILAQLGRNPGSNNTDNQNMFESCMDFSYSYGLVFVLTRIVKEDADFSRMLEAIPISTEQILHIQKYDAKEQPMKTVLEKSRDKISSIPGMTLLLDTSLGEYFIRQMFTNILQNDNDTAKNAAAGWGGDRIFVLKSGEHLLFIWDTLWDSDKDADEFLRCYADYSKARYNVENLPPDMIFDATLTTDDDKVLIKKNGNRILIMEGQIITSTLKNILKSIGL